MGVYRGLVPSRLVQWRSGMSFPPQKLSCQLTAGIDSFGLRNHTMLVWFSGSSCLSRGDGFHVRCYTLYEGDL